MKLIALKKSIVHISHFPVSLVHLLMGTLSNAIKEMKAYFTNSVQRRLYNLNYSLKASIKNLVFLGLLGRSIS